jgi:hypothetical protein
MQRIKESDALFDIMWRFETLGKSSFDVSLGSFRIRYILNIGMYINVDLQGFVKAIPGQAMSLKGSVVVLDQDPLVQGTDPAADPVPDPYVIKQK